MIGHHEVIVQPDLSNAVPFLAAALVTGGAVTIAGWPAVTAQPASQILDLLTAFGADCTLAAQGEEEGGGGLTVTGTGRIRPVTADLADVSESATVAAVLAALADGPSRLTGIGHMRGHETDRLAALAAEIGALGGDVSELPDGLAIRPRPLRAGRPFASYDDHRMVMAAAVLGLAVPGIEVENAATVGKTFPGFTRVVGGDAGARSLNRRPRTQRPGRGRRPGPAGRGAPGRGPGAGPRTRTRPRAFVAAVDRGRYGCLIGDRPVTAMRARELGRRSVVVGDQVALAGDISGRAGHPRPGGPGRARARPCCAARPTTPTRSNGSSWPTRTSW